MVPKRLINIPDEPKPYCPPWVVPTEAEMKINEEELMQSEMFYWRNMHPYRINGRFICRIVYNEDKR